MTNVFHKDFVDDDNHALTARTYADLAARNADTAFQVAANVDKTVRVEDIDGYFILFSVGPAMWVEISGSGNLASLAVEDNFITLNAVTTPTDANADTGGIILQGTTDKLIQWLDAIDAWTFNQNLATDQGMVIGSLTAPPTDVSLHMPESDRAFLPNQGTAAERDALTPIEGMLYYNLTVNDMQFYNGVSWTSMLGGDVSGPPSSLIDSVPTYSSTNGENIQDPALLFILGGAAGLGTATPTGSSILDVVSTTLGSRLAPSMTAAQKNAIGTPATALSVFDTDEGRYEFFDGSIWKGFEEGALNIVYFKDAAGLPAPAGGVITLLKNTVYVIYNPDPSSGINEITLSDRIELPDAGGVTLAGLATISTSLVYTGTGSFFTTNSTFIGTFLMSQILVKCPNGTVFDLDGSVPVGEEFFPRITIQSCGFRDLVAIGTVKTINLTIRGAAFAEADQGLVIDGGQEITISNVDFIAWNNAADAVMVNFIHQVKLASITNCVFDLQPNETVFNISPSITAPLILLANAISGTGAVYTTGISGSITSAVDDSQAGTVTAVSAVAGINDVVMTDVAHGLVEGEIIVTSGFSDSNYNGTFDVLEVVDADNFRIHALFTATDTGSWTSARVQFNAVNTLVAGEGVQVTDTTSYDAGYRVLSASGTLFIVNATFVASETGNFNTDSLDETDPLLAVIANSGTPDSAVIASGEMNGNAATTSTTNGTYGDMNVTGMDENPVSQRFELTDASIGEFTYRGLQNISGTLTAVISGFKSGSTANYRFAVSIDGVAPVFASAHYAPLEIRTTKNSVTVLSPIDVVTDQTIHVMIAGDGTGDALTISDMTINIVD